MIRPADGGKVGWNLLSPWELCSESEKTEKPWLMRKQRGYGLV